MKQIQKARRHRRSPSGRREPLAIDLRDPDIVHAHQIADRSAGRAVRQTHCGRADPGTVTRHG